MATSAPTARGGQAPPSTLSAVIVGEGSLPIRCGELLLSAGHRVAGIISPDDAVRRWGREQGLRVAAPDDEPAAVFEADAVDYLFSIVNYSVLPDHVLAMPRRGAINYHDGPLPRYAGLHATSWAILNRETRHAVSWHAATELIDGGDVYVQEPVEIAPDDTAISLNLRCYDAAAVGFERLLGMLVSGEAPTPQDLSARTYFGRHHRPPGGGLLRWTDPGESIEALVRALDFGPTPNPLGLARVDLGAEVLHVTGARLGEASTASPGTVTHTDRDAMTVATTTRDVVVTGVRRVGGPVIRIGDLVDRGELRVGDVLPVPDDARWAVLDDAVGRAARAEAFWRRRLAGLQPVLLPRLRADVPGEAPSSAATGSTSPGTVDLPLDAPRPGDLANGATDPAGTGGEIDPIAAMLAAFVAYLARITGAETFHLGLHDPSISTPDPRLFASEVPLRATVDPLASFASLAGLVSRELARVRKRGPFATDLAARTPALESLRAGITHPVSVAIVDDLADTDTATSRILTLELRPDGTGARLRFDPDRIAPEVVERMSRELATVVGSAGEDPSRSVARLRLLPEEDLGQILGPFNDTARAFDTAPTLHALVERQAATTPDRVAVRSGQRSLTYAELDAHANRLAHHLTDLGVSTTDGVGIFTERTEEMVVAMLAAMKASGGYVPLDPGYPADRTRFMIADGTLHTILVHRALADRLPEHEARVVVLDDPSPWASRPDTSPGVDVDPERTAYTIYTSGSTGRPKGVLIPHRAAVNLLEVMRREPGLGPDDRMLAIAPIAFDMSVVEIWLTLSVGGEVNVVPREIAEDGERLVAHLAAVRATAMNATPTSYRLLVESGWMRTPGFKAMSGGEPMPRELANAILDRVDELWNLYGPTETTVYDTTGWKVPRGDAPLHVGIPMANTTAYVCDPRLELLPVGVPGELLIGGVCVAHGYLNRPELTAEKFIDHAFADEPPRRLYRSGDVCRWKPDGTIEVLGRIDHQVKIRGFRVELGEIENVIDQHPAVGGSVVMAREDAPGDRRLVAYVVPERPVTSEETLVTEVKERVREVLPAYMMPAAFVVLEAFPRTPNGKVDRKSLPAPATAATRSAGEYRAPTTPLESTLVAVWEEVIGVERIGVDEDFFDLGGHSLLVQGIRKRLEERTGHHLSTIDLYQHPTVRGLAALLEAGGTSGSAGARSDAADRPRDAGSGPERDRARRSRRSPDEILADLPRPGVVSRSRFYKLRMTLQRFLLPGFVVSLYYYLRDRATVSPRAEVEVSPLLRFGRGSVVGSYVKLKATAGPVIFGERCAVGNASFITGDEQGIVIGDNFVCGPNTTIISSTYVHDRLDVHIWDQGLVSAGVRIGHNVWVGASVTILDGTELGDNTIVVANSVVDRKHPPNVVLRGNPAEVIAVRE